MVPSINFLLRQAARERLAAVRVLSDEAKQRHLAMAEVYERRAQELRNDLKVRGPGRTLGADGG